MTVQKQARQMAEMAVENGECGAQLEIADQVLRDALILSIYQQIERALRMDAQRPTP